MYEREELKRYTSNEIEEIDDALLEASEDGIIKMTRVYIASEADSVMDAMEARIKELEAEVIGYKASLERADFKMCEKDARIKELEGIKHADIVRIAELEAENAELKKKVPVWHKLDKPLYVDENGNDVWDLPVEDEADANGDVYAVYKCGVCGTEPWDEIDPEVIAMWCELPTAPQATEESSATEKENG